MLLVVGGALADFIIANAASLPLMYKSWHLWLQIAGNLPYRAYVSRDLNFKS